jgi:putative glutamine amidotransferase
MARPTIGITCSVGDIRSGEWDEHAAYSPIAYVRAVQRAGARAILLVADDHDAADPSDLLRTLDGVILSGGGSDVAPHRYGQTPHPATADEEPHRDGFEIALARAAKQRDIPVLGICRGMQLLAVAHGGSLVQHLPDVVGHEGHRPEPGVYGHHDVQLADGSLAATLLGPSVNVPSYHHQGLDSPGSLTVTGWADDQTPEVLEDPARRFCLGVLWHPEAGDDPRLFTALTSAARDR